VRRTNYEVPHYAVFPSFLKIYLAFKCMHLYLNKKSAKDLTKDTMKWWDEVDEISSRLHTQIQLLCGYSASFVSGMRLKLPDKCVAILNGVSPSDYWV
jgi:hypothetical protein